MAEHTLQKRRSDVATVSSGVSRSSTAWYTLDGVVRQRTPCVSDKDAPDMVGALGDDEGVCEGAEVDGAPRAADFAADGADAELERDQGWAWGLSTSLPGRGLVCGFGL